MRRLAMKSTSSVQPSHLAAISFLGLVLLQGGHELEHIVQVIQRYAGIGSGFWNNPKGAGILGTWIDIEPVHIAYNGIFLFLIALCFWLGGFLRSLASRHPFTFWIMSFALFFEAYHFVEHIFKILQFIDTGMNGTPGILGHFFNLVWLHFTYNTIAYLPLLLVFFIDGYHQSAMAALSNALRIGRPKLRQV